MSDWFPDSVVPFAGIAWWAVAGVFAAHALGSFIRGAFGFGSNMPIVIITTFLLGPHHAILLALLTTFLAQATLARQGWQTADWQVAKPLVAGLMEQGMSAGAAMAFMVAGAVSSIPAMTAVYALVRPPVFAAYVGLGFVGAVLAGIAWGAGVGIFTG